LFHQSVRLVEQALAAERLLSRSRPGSPRRDPLNEVERGAESLAFRPYDSRF
jgi:hypothetical protein